ncbi:ankyrin repeat-containing domain protein [Phaeosphaeriaceae sp. PMI808]|nr:ankyrin repeat-containing domain protein [Phaeosphaeriaceae sp. PMI808]
MVEFLICLEADIHAAPAPRDGGTALQHAAAFGCIRTVKILLDHGADINAPASINGQSALEAAAKNSRLDTVKMLLNARKMECKEKDEPQLGRAKKYARDDGHFDFADMLEEKQQRMLEHDEQREHDVISEIS